jgi:hypothetical protein
VITTTPPEGVDPEVYARAHAIVHRRKIVGHEAAHAAGFIAWAGLIPRRIAVAPYAGVVNPDWEAYSLPRDKVPELIMAVIAGPATAGQIPTPPFLPELSNDERALDALTKLGGIDDRAYSRLVTATYRRMGEPEFQELDLIFRCLLENRDELDGDQIRFVLERMGLTEYIDTKEAACST